MPQREGHQCLLCKHARWKHTEYHRYFDYCIVGSKKERKGSCGKEEMVCRAVADIIKSTTKMELTP